MPDDQIAEVLTFLRELREKRSPKKMSFPTNPEEDDQIVEVITFLHDLRMAAVWFVCALTPPFDGETSKYRVECIRYDGQEPRIECWIETYFAKDEHVLWAIDIDRVEGGDWLLCAAVEWPNEDPVCKSFEDRELATFSELRIAAFEALEQIFSEMDTVKEAVRKKFPSIPDKDE